MRRQLFLKTSADLTACFTTLCHVTFLDLLSMTQSPAPGSRRESREELIDVGCDPAVFFIQWDQRVCR